MDKYVFFNLCVSNTDKNRYVIYHNVNCFQFMDDKTLQIGCVALNPECKEEVWTPYQYEIDVNEETAFEFYKLDEPEKTTKVRDIICK